MTGPPRRGRDREAVVTSEHYVVLGLARVRSAWFGQVSRWATSGSLAAEFVKCVSGDELGARLRSGRSFSALLIDGGLPSLDRDLIDLARSQGCAVIVVDESASRRDWSDLGVSAVLIEPLDRHTVATVIGEHAHPISEVDQPIAAPAPTTAGGWRGRLIAVLGGGGTGTSVTAMAAAQGLALDARHGGRVALADLALRADQAMLHDAGDVIPGLQELVEAHRRGRPGSDEVRSLLFACPRRGYDVLLGLRRHRDWSALRPRAVAAALDGLLRAYQVVVADLEPDLEGASDCGSVDVEERNALARACATRADVVVLTALPTVTGLHRAVQLLDEVTRAGIDPRRVLPVVNRAPRAMRQRAAVTAAVAGLAARLDGVAEHLPSPLFVPERRQIDDCLRTGDPLPQPVASLVAAGVDALLERASPPTAPTPEPITPGSLGSWRGDGG
jgi:hypothetical protein